MISKIKNGSSKRKLKIFLLLLTCATLALFISKLSESYSTTLTFKLVFVNIPKDLLLLSASKNTASIKLEGNGFLFLRSNFKRKQLTVDLGEIKKVENSYLLTASDFKKQVEEQLQKPAVLLEMDSDPLYFTVDSIYSKKVSVIPRIDITMAQNFLLDGKLKVEPKDIIVTGPKNEIDTLNHIYTETKNFSNLSDNFQSRLALRNPTHLKNTSFSGDFILLSGRVSKFSEVLIKIPVEVVNVPKGMEIRTFPEEVSILCKAKLEHLKDLSRSDFRLIADYTTASNQSEIGLLLELVKRPDSLINATLMENEVEYILKRN